MNGPTDITPLLPRRSTETSSKPGPSKPQVPDLTAFFAQLPKPTKDTLTGTKVKSSASKSHADLRSPSEEKTLQRGHSLVQLGVFSPRRRSRTLSSPKKIFRSDIFPKKKFRKEVESIYQGFVQKYGSINEKSEQDFHREMNHTLFFYGLHHLNGPTFSDDLCSEAIETLWQKLISSEGILLATTISYLTKCTTYLNHHTETVISTFTVREYLERLKETLSSLTRCNNLTAFFVELRKGDNQVIEFVKILMTPTVYARLQTYSAIVIPEAFIIKAKNILWVSYYLCHIVTLYDWKAIPASKFAINPNDILRTYTSHKNNCFGFSKITIVPYSADKEIRPRKIKIVAHSYKVPERTKSLYKFVEMDIRWTPEQYAKQLFEDVISLLGYEIPNDSISSVAAQIASGHVEDDLLNSPIMKILMATSFANSSRLTKKFMKNQPGIFVLYKKNYPGLFGDLFEAKFSSLPGTRSVKIGLTESGFYVDQLMSLQTYVIGKSKNSEFLTYTFACRTEYDKDKDQFIFNHSTLTLNKQKFFQLLAKWPLGELVELLQKFTVVMKWHIRDSTNPYDFHNQEHLRRFGILSLNDLEEEFEEDENEN